MACHSLLLKGSDREVVSAARALGLTVQVKPEYEFPDTWHEDFVEVISGINFEHYENGRYYIDESFKFKTEWISQLKGENTGRNTLKRLHGAKR